MKNLVNIRKGFLMTIQQVSEKFGYSESSIRTKFTRTVAAIKRKYGVDLVRCKNGKEIFYQISDNRAISMYKESEKPLIIDEETLSLANYQFLIMLGIVATPQRVFRGTRKDFLKYLEMPADNKYIQILNSALCSLVERGYIEFNEDMDYIIVYIKRVMERRLQFNLKLLQECKGIVEKEHRNKVKLPQLIKVWLAFQIFYDQQGLFKYDDIAEITGLSKTQIMEAKKILQKNNVLKAEIVRLKDADGGFHSIGQTVERLNGIFY